MMLTRVLHFQMPAQASHRARDPVDLADPLLYAIHRAERGQAKSLATREQTLAEMVLAMRLTDAGRK